MRRMRTVKERVTRLKTSTGEMTETDEETAELLGTCFHKVFVKDPAQNEEHSELEDSNQAESTKVKDSFDLQISFDVETVKQKLLMLKEDKSQGPDLFHPMLLKSCAEVISRPLSTIFQKSFHDESVPVDWKMANISPIFKKGHKVDPENYRPISLTSIPSNHGIHNQRPNCQKIRRNILRKCTSARIHRRQINTDKSAGNTRIMD